jgi:hypothetical protein
MSLAALLKLPLEVVWKMFDAISEVLPRRIKYRAGVKREMQHLENLENHLLTYERFLKQDQKGKNSFPDFRPNQTKISELKETSQKFLGTRSAQALDDVRYDYGLITTQVSQIREDALKIDPNWANGLPNRAVIPMPSGSMLQYNWTGPYANPADIVINIQSTRHLVQDNRKKLREL